MVSLLKCGHAHQPKLLNCCSKLSDPVYKIGISLLLQQIPAVNPLSWSTSGIWLNWIFFYKNVRRGLDVALKIGRVKHFTNIPGIQGTLFQNWNVAEFDAKVCVGNDYIDSRKKGLWHLPPSPLWLNLDASFLPFPSIHTNSDSGPWLQWWVAESIIHSGCWLSLWSTTGLNHSHIFEACCLSPGHELTCSECGWKATIMACDSVVIPSPCNSYSI